MFGFYILIVRLVVISVIKFSNRIVVSESPIHSYIQGVYLGGSPPRDAPSPTNQDDIYAHGVEEALHGEWLFHS